jgi:hypothetical protein
MWLPQQFFFNNCVLRGIRSKLKDFMPHTKKTILLFIALLVAGLTPAEAQRYKSRQIIRAYPALGATVSQMRGDELRGFRKWGITAGVGAMVDLTEDNKWHLSMEAAFSQRGAYNNTSSPYALFHFTMNYVDIPLTVHFTDPYGGVTFGMGLVYSRLVQQPHGFMAYKPHIFMPDTANLTFLKNDFAAAIDVRIPVWRGLTLNFRYQHSILPVKRDWNFWGYRNEGDIKPQSWSNDCYNSSISLRVLYVFGDDNNKYKNKNKKKK